MKYFLSVIICIFAFSFVGFSQCRENPESSDERRKILEQFNNILKTSIPSYSQFPLNGFFVYDLTATENFYMPATESRRSYGCINFADNHIYHFAPYDFEKSESHIAIFKDKKLEVFKSINCGNSEQKLLDVVKFVEEKLKNHKNKNDILIRLKNYRTYGFYFTTDQERVYCSNTKIPENSDENYNREKILLRFSTILENSVSENVTERLSKFFVEESRAIGFFVFDLTEPLNKQTSLLERIEFRNNHVYHFALIDAPFSFSNIVVLNDGKLKIFKAINCKGKGDSLEDVIGYLNEKLKNDKNKDEIIKRVKNYRDYGVYASFNGLSTPQCEEIVKTEK